MTVKEYHKWTENAAKNKGMTVQEYRKLKHEEMARNKGYENFNEYNKHRKFCRKYFECSKEEYRDSSKV